MNIQGWFPFLADQETLKSLFQHHNLKTSILLCSTFFMVQFTEEGFLISPCYSLELCKKPVNPKGNKPWIFIGLMPKLQYFAHLMWRADSLEKTLMLGKDWRQEQKDKWVWDSLRENETSDRNSHRDECMAFLKQGCKPRERNDKHTALDGNVLEGEHFERSLSLTRHHPFRESHVKQ